MGTIEINGESFPYEHRELTYENAVYLDKEIAKENLLLFKKVLDDKGYEFLLMYGTLLGAVREQDFIPYDIDIDLVMYKKEDIISCIHALWEEGLHLCRYDLSPSHCSFSFIRKDVYIDVYTVEKISFPLSLAYCWCGSLIHPKKLLKGTQDYPFLGTNFKVPLKLEQNLVFMYGKTWKIPLEGKPAGCDSKLKWLLQKIFPRSLRDALREMLSPTT